MIYLIYKSYILKKCVFLPLVLGLVCSGVMILLKGLGISIFRFSWVELLLFVVYMVLQILNRFSVLLIRLEYHSKEYSLINVLNKILYGKACKRIADILEGKEYQQWIAE